MSNSMKRTAMTAGLSLYDDDDGYITSTSSSSVARDAKRVNRGEEQDGENSNAHLDVRPATFVTACGWRKGDREEMQDRHIIEENFNVGAKPDDIKRSGFFALFDGHAGSAASELCAQKFSKRLAANCAKFAQGGLPTIEKSMKKIFIDSYKNIDDDFLAEAKKRRPTLKDGTTATTIILINDVLYSANIGDSRAVVCRLKPDMENAIAMQLTTDHSPLAFNERMRIQKAGGIVKDGRVMGVLEVSRSIGDGQFKAHGVSCLPDVKKLTLTADDLFIVLACDGLWKTFSSEDALKFILAKYEALKNDKKFLEKISADARVTEANNGDAAELRSSAIWARVADDLSAESVIRGCGDNVSVILVVFTASVERRLDGTPLLPSPTPNQSNNDK